MISSTEAMAHLETVGAGGFCVRPLGGLGVRGPKTP